MLAVMVESPEMLGRVRDTDNRVTKTIESEARDEELALLRYFAASGMAFHTLIGLTELDGARRNRLFDRLQDDASWAPLEKKRKTAK